VYRSCLLQQLLPLRGERAVDPAPVVLTEEAAEQPAVLQPRDEPGGGAVRERGRAGELLHAHVPAVLAVERVEHRVLDDRQIEPGLQRLLQRLFQPSV
jgi:hypothetical protein